MFQHELYKKASSALYETPRPAGLVSTHHRINWGRQTNEKNKTLRFHKKKKKNSDDFKLTNAKVRCACVQCGWHLSRAFAFTNLERLLSRTALKRANRRDLRSELGEWRNCKYVYTLKKKKKFLSVHIEHGETSRSLSQGNLFSEV